MAAVSQDLLETVVDLQSLPSFKHTVLEETSDLMLLVLEIGSVRLLI